MGPKTKSLEALEELDILEDKPEEVESVSDDELEVKKKVVKKPKESVYKLKPKDPNAPKKERSAGQIAAWEKALEKRQGNRDSRAVIKESMSQSLKEKQLASKILIEKKIVSKAISIKKKQIRKEAMLDEVSDDDTDIEIVKKQIRKQPSRTVNQPDNKVSFNFI